MSVSVFENGFLSGLLGDPEVAALFHADADIEGMLRFEKALAQAQAEMGLIPSDAADAILEAIGRFRPDLTALRNATMRDGVVLPALIRQLRSEIGEPHAKWLHFGATSQDVIDTSLILRIKSAFYILYKRTNQLIEALEAIKARHGQNSLMGRTRMQSALPITVADRVDGWIIALMDTQERLGEIRRRVLQLQLGGPVGTLSEMKGEGLRVAERMALMLEVSAPIRQWHARRGSMAECAGWLSLLSGALGKMGQDVSLMAQNEVGEIKLSGGGGSSAMPHKQNPVAAETLVALARFNATLLSGMHQSLVHENERSGAAWTLEWMILPQMFVATGASLATAQRLVSEVVAIGGEEKAGG